MTKLVDCEIWLAMNEDGDWSVGTDADVLSLLAEEQGGYTARVVKVTVKMSPPIVAEATVTVPDDAELQAVA